MITIPELFGVAANAPGVGPHPPSAVGGDFQIYYHTASADGSFHQILDQNPNRVAIYLGGAEQSSPIYYSFTSVSNTNDAMPSYYEAGPRQFTFRDLGVLVTLPMYVYGNFGPSIKVWEVIYFPV